MARWVTVRRFEAPWEAEIARVRLEEENIPVVIDNQAVIGLFGGLSTTLGGVHVAVPPEHAAQSREILEAMQSAPAGAPGWKCSHCGADVDAGFDVCWSCGTTYDGTADPAFSAVDPEYADPEYAADGDEEGVDHAPGPAPRAGQSSGHGAGAPVDPPDRLTWICSHCGREAPLGHVACPVCGGVRHEAANPYAVTSGTGLPGEDAISAGARAHAAMPEAGDAQVLRAWRAAVFGIMSCPGLLHLYSLWLLLTLDADFGDLRTADRWRYVAAAAVDVTVFLAAARLVWVFS